MRRLKDLDVHEISLVKRAANKRRYLIVKSDLGAAQMAKSPAAPSANAAQNLMAAMANIPREKIEHMAAIAKSAKARVAKADEDGSDAELQDAAGSELSEDAQNALKAAFRILAPYSEAISADTMADFSEALGVQADVADDAEGADADETVAMSEGDDKDKEGDVGKADAEGDDKKDPLDNLKKADDDSEDKDDDEEKTQKAAEEEVKDKVEGDDVPPSVTKADGMPDFADADDSDMEAAMAAARTAYAAAMEQRGKKQAAQKADDGDDKEDDDDGAMAKSAIEKSAFNLSALDKRHQRILEPVFKSHMERFAALEQANKELIAKSAKLDDEMRRREFITKAAREYSALGPAEEIGENLLRLHKKDPEGVAAWERIMKAANEQMRQGGSEGLFEELGTAMSGGLNASGLPDDEIRQHVDAIVQKSATGKSRERLEAEFLLTPVGRRLYAKSTNRN